jgi:hypothetical protein
VPTREHESVEATHIELRPACRRLERRVLREIGVERLGLGVGAKLAEEDAGEQPRVRRRLSAMLGGEDHLVPGSAEQFPGNCDLGDVEVVIGEGEKDARHAPKDTRTDICGENRDLTPRIVVRAVAKIRRGGRGHGRDSKGGRANRRVSVGASLAVRRRGMSAIDRPAGVGATV